MKTLKWAAQAALLAPPLFFTAWLVLTLATRGTASAPLPTPAVAAFATFTPPPQSSPPGNTPVPAGRPTPLPAPTQPPQPLARLTTGVNLRSGPGAGYAIVGAGNAGDTFPITGRNQAGDWWRIRAATGPAWIYGPYVQLAGPPANVPVVAAPPTPTPAH